MQTISIAQIASPHCVDTFYTPMIYLLLTDMPLETFRGEGARMTYSIKTHLNVGTL